MPFRAQSPTSAVRRRFAPSTTTCSLEIDGSMPLTISTTFGHVMYSWRACCCAIAHPAGATGQQNVIHICLEENNDGKQSETKQLQNKNDNEME